MDPSRPGDDLWLHNLESEVTGIHSRNTDMDPEPDEKVYAGLRWLWNVERSRDDYSFLTDYLTRKQEKECKTDQVSEGTRQEHRTAMRKESRQAARSVLPNATETKIYVTANARACRHFIEQRGSRFAEPEIRMLAYTVWKILVQVSPNLFSDYSWRTRTDYYHDGLIPLDVTTPYRKV
jgi:thymidylate synthase ThyX